MYVHVSIMFTAVIVLLVFVYGQVYAVCMYMCIHNYISVKIVGVVIKGHAHYCL